MEKIFLGLPENEEMAEQLRNRCNGSAAQYTLRKFPDEETYVRIESDVRNKHCILVCSLYHPDDKIIPLYFIAKLCRDLQAAKITLVAPYLSYMRQDKRFAPGEAVTSDLFAQLLSGMVDELITIDPHLHRKHSMAELYSIPCTVLHASGLISQYIRGNIEKPLIVGPDSESEQWVSKVALSIDAPFIILEKLRMGDMDVSVSRPEIEEYKDHTPVLVDDIISTAQTMIETVKHITNAGMQPPVVIGVHAIFAGNAYLELKQAGTAEIVTCNTIKHVSNKISVVDLIAQVI